MRLPPIVFVFVMGCVAAILSEFPHLLKDMVDGIQAFHDEVTSTPHWGQSEFDVRPLQTACRLAGAGLILISVLAFATRF